MFEMALRASSSPVSEDVAAKTHRDIPGRLIAWRISACRSSRRFSCRALLFCPYQRALESGRGRSNCRSLFGIETIPSDNYIRDMLNELPGPEKTAKRSKLLLLLRMCRHWWGRGIEPQAHALPGSGFDLMNYPDTLGDAGSR